MSNHPGIYIKKLYLDKYNLSVTDAARLLDISRKNFSLLINGHAGISAEMAIRLEKVFGEVGAADYWLSLQKRYELNEAKKKKWKLKRYKA